MTVATQEKRKTRKVFVDYLTNVREIHFVINVEAFI